MFKKLSLLCCLYLGITSYCHAEASTTTGLQWYANYEQASELAQKQHKPIVLFFTGSDWCGWCTRLEEEVLNTKEFANDAANQYIFVKLDFPLYTPIDQQLAAQNKQLRKKYDIRSFPTLVLLDEKGREIGTTGYRPGGGHSYAIHLKELMDNFQNYQKKFQEVSKGNLSATQLRSLYEQAKTYHYDNDAIALMREGLKKNDDLFFMREKLRFLAEEGRIHDPESVALKNKLLALDSNNENHIHFDVAVIEFEAFVDEMEREKYSPELAVAPLVHYIEKFNNKDPDSIWRLQMIISQVFLDNNKLAKALLHAKSSYQAAPADVKPEIALAIDNIQAQLHSGR